MGLRHLFVIPDEPRVIGLLTRKDVTKDNATLVLGEQVNMEQDDSKRRFGAILCAVLCCPPETTCSILLGFAELACT